MRGPRIKTDKQLRPPIRRRWLRLRLGKAYYAGKRYLLWYSPKFRWAKERREERLPCVQFAHATPLTVVERYRHSHDVFPDANRTQPSGSGATCAYPHRDLMIRNDTEHRLSNCACGSGRPIWRANGGRWSSRNTDIRSWNGRLGSPRCPGADMCAITRCTGWCMMRQGLF